MKKFIYTLITLAVALLVFNLFQINYDNLFGPKSSSALIGVLACLCVVVIMCILLVSRKIKEKVEKNK